MSLPETYDETDKNAGDAAMTADVAMTATCEILQQGS
eukprot:CAMPEP_0206135496 /NCGR_PEP_ID=MMETSP1473-20131121/774_1 /ASSEMBLY_ACC=CAM_ASM_001109 /TAXON_ID=1461547 /ORGANISM="Stichococcus sp, Strain RCC1054" /LENGTH=36 /DNA_ID= /DNA_START= /DNA_END= /DNA_ORIENTATION=